MGHHTKIHSARGALMIHQDDGFPASSEIASFIPPVPDREGIALGNAACLSCCRRSHAYTSGLLSSTEMLHSLMEARAALQTEDWTAVLGQDKFTILRHGVVREGHSSDLVWKTFSCSTSRRSNSRRSTDVHGKCSTGQLVSTGRRQRSV